MDYNIIIINIGRNIILLFILLFFNLFDYIIHIHIINMNYLFIF